MEKNAKVYKIIAFLLVLVVGGYFVYQYLQPSIAFKQDIVQVEINSTYSIQDNINKYHQSSEQDYIIDSSVDFTKLGEYVIKFTHSQKKTIFSYALKVVDTIAPTYDLLEATIEQNEALEAIALVENLTDETNTTISFNQEYDFTQIGELTVEVKVEDEGGNVTLKQTKVTVLEADITPPTITGVSDRTIQQGDSINFLAGISVSDNRDENPTITVDQGSFNRSTPGSYTVTYIASDEKGNESKKSCTITVKAPTPVSGRVVYLTIDDGPSYLTGEVLDILDKYQVKATFFVTGQSPSYFHMIKEAYNRGHQIALHTYSHSYGNVYSSVSNYYADLEKIGNVVANQIGFVPKLIRFPGGSSNTVSANYSKGIMSYLVSDVMQKGYYYFDWNASIGDGGSVKDADRYVNQMISQSSGKSQVMLLMHDGSGCRQSVEALPRIIEWYLNGGYEFKTINESTRGFHHGVNN